MGEKPQSLAAELHFQAVDGRARVWANGTYVGCGDTGPERWGKPFILDVTEATRWGAENQITVRMLDSKFAGGIREPVIPEALK